MKIAFVRTEHLPHLGTHEFIGIIPFNNLDELFDFVDEITDPNGCEYILLNAGESIFFDHKVDTEEGMTFSSPTKSCFSEELTGRINFDEEEGLNKWKKIPEQKE